MAKCVCIYVFMQQVVEFLFENYNVVLFALDVNVIDQENQQRARKVISGSPLLFHLKVLESLLSLTLLYVVAFSTIYLFDHPFFCSEFCKDARTLVAHRWTIRMSYFEIDLDTLHGCHLPSI